MKLEPAALDRKLDAGADLRAAGLQGVEERRVDLLDTDAAVLDGFDASGKLDELPAAASGLANGRLAVSFIDTP
ncbi:hypothetical protein Q3C01_17725 [Bradyrhizobium sp. UFLA05-109]